MTEKTFRRICHFARIKSHKNVRLISMADSLCWHCVSNSITLIPLILWKWINATTESKMFSQEMSYPLSDFRWIWIDWFRIWDCWDLKTNQQIWVQHYLKYGSWNKFFTILIRYLFFEELFCTITTRYKNWNLLIFILGSSGFLEKWEVGIHQIVPNEWLRSILYQGWECFQWIPSIQK